MTAATPGTGHQHRPAASTSAGTNATGANSTKP